MGASHGKKKEYSLQSKGPSGSKKPGSGSSAFGFAGCVNSGAANMAPSSRGDDGDKKPSSGRGCIQQQQQTWGSDAVASHEL